MISVVNQVNPCLNSVVLRRDPESEKMHHLILIVNERKKYGKFCYFLKKVRKNRRIPGKCMAIETLQIRLCKFFHLSEGAQWQEKEY